MPDADLSFLWWAEMPFSRWRDNYAAVHGGIPLSNVPECEFLVADPLDEGVLDLWKIRVEGAPFFPDANTAGLWKVVLGSVRGETFKAMAEHVERTYYKSRRLGLKLSDASPITRKRWSQKTRLSQRHTQDSQK